MNTLQTDVTAFHKAFGHPAPDAPHVEMTEELADEMVRRSEWLIEEAQELAAAARAGDLVDVIDALLDSIYFAVGGFAVLGHDMSVFWKNVHEANMSKLGPDGKPILREGDGKVLKPEGWVAPETRHEETLRKVLA